MEKLIDISHWNKITDWSKLGTVILKCTEGLDYIDPTYAERKSRLSCLGAYHFFRDYEPVKQAEFFCKSAGEVELYILDFEIHIDNPVEKCNAFLKRVKELTGKEPVIYLNSSTAKAYDWDTSYRLWIANYGVNDGTRHLNPAIGKWKEFFIHQYTSRGKVNEIIGNVDLNYMKDTTEATTEIKDTIIKVKPMMQLIGQRDPKWCDVTIGKSKSTLYYYGCTISTISMLSSWYGCFKDPGWLAKNLRFLNDLILWQSITEKLCFKFVWRQYGLNESKILGSLKGETTSCILQINGGHWVVAIRKDADNYYIADPWSNNRRYIPKRQITGSSHFDKK